MFNDGFAFFWLVLGAACVVALWSIFWTPKIDAQIRSGGWVRLSFAERLPKRLYGCDLRQAYLDSCVVELTPVLAALMGVDPASVLRQRVADIRSPAVIQLLNHGINDESLLTVGEIGEFDAGSFMIFPEFNQERTEVRLWVRPAPLIPANVVH